ncbi:hypothetical protein PAXRUDRAFT_25755 [Paxillus rubicundulus Ve08.2h10]|uniref:Uncharacterized protein n=1 Tax=Paxillus rubicundulus Ve08.2h10 TaxID=930991 RepID=A0A0D0DXL1_9AGAM|nr:hypothetical protein PAXRUDRAFT_25755 [Paxillus rubicundulus Ve08.2h10]
MSSEAISDDTFFQINTCVGQCLVRTMMLFLVSVWLATQAVFNETMWIEYRGYPGGPGQYWAIHMSDWYMAFGSTAVVAATSCYRVIIVPSVYGWPRQPLEWRSTGFPALQG